MRGDERNPGLVAAPEGMTMFERVASLVTIGGGGTVLYGVIDPEASSLALVAGSSAFFAGVACLALSSRRRSP